MKSRYLLFFILLLNACHAPSPRGNQDQNYEKIADKITAITAQKIEAQTGLHLMGVGGGAIDKIRKLNMSFQHFGEITLDQGRELLIFCINEYLTAVNSNEEIRTHLIHYPFTPKDIQIEIFINQENHKDVPIGALSVICEIDGILKYKTRQPDPIILHKIHEETYEEAVKILETQGPINKVHINSKSTENI